MLVLIFFDYKMFSAKEQTLSSLQRSLNIDPNVVCYIEIAKLHVQMDQMRSSKCKEVGDEISAKVGQG